MGPANGSCSVASHLYCRESQSSFEARLRLFDLIVERDDALKLVDFGVSRKIAALDERAAATQSISGLTTIFAAPERVQGEAVVFISTIMRSEWFFIIC